MNIHPTPDPLMKIHLKPLIQITLTRNQNPLLSILLSLPVHQISRQIQKFVHLFIRLHHAHKHFVFFLLNHYQLDPHIICITVSLEVLLILLRYLQIFSHSLLHEFPTNQTFSKTYLYIWLTTLRVCIQQLVTERCHVLHLPQIKPKRLIIPKLVMLTQQNPFHYYMHLFLLFHQLK